MTKNKEEEELNKYSKYYKEVGPYLGLGLQLALTVGIMVFIGYWLDNKTGLSPLFILIFSGVGIFAALYNFIKTVLSLSKDNGKKKDS